MPDLINDIGPANFYIAWALAAPTIILAILAAVIDWRRQR